MANGWLGSKIEWGEERNNAPFPPEGLGGALRIHRGGNTSGIGSGGGGFGRLGRKGDGSSGIEEGETGGQLGHVDTARGVVSTNSDPRMSKAKQAGGYGLAERSRERGKDWLRCKNGVG